MPDEIMTNTVTNTVTSWPAETVRRSLAEAVALAEALDSPLANRSEVLYQAVLEVCERGGEIDVLEVFVTAHDSASDGGLEWARCLWGLEADEMAAALGLSPALYQEWAAWGIPSNYAGSVWDLLMATTLLAGLDDPDSVMAAPGPQGSMQDLVRRGQFEAVREQLASLARVPISPRTAPWRACPTDAG